MIQPLSIEKLSRVIVASVKGGADAEQIQDLIRSQREASKIRPTLEWFVEQMEGKLRVHDRDRGSLGWRRDSVESLHKHFLEEVEELRRALSQRDKFKASARIVEECADAANMLMMIADVTFEHWVEKGAKIMSGGKG